MWFTYYDQAFGPVSRNTNMSAPHENKKPVPKILLIRIFKT